MINAVNRTPQTIPGDLTGTLKAQNLEQAAGQFEALFLRTMLSQMRKATDALTEGDNPFSSKQQQMMRDFYDDKLASVLSSQRSCGVAEMIVRQLGPQAEGMERALKLSQPLAALEDENA